MYLMHTCYEASLIPRLLSAFVSCMCSIEKLGTSLLYNNHMRHSCASERWVYLAAGIYVLNIQMGWYMHTLTTQFCASDLQAKRCGAHS